MTKRFNSAFTMFVHLKGHQVLQCYFAVRDARTAANDAFHPPRAGIAQLPRVDPERIKR